MHLYPTPYASHLHSQTHYHPIRPRNLLLLSYNFSRPHNFTEASKCNKLCSSSAHRMAVPHYRPTVQHRTQKTQRKVASPGGAFLAARQFLSDYPEFYENLTRSERELIIQALGSFQNDKNTIKHIWTTPFTWFPCSKCN